METSIYNQNNEKNYLRPIWLADCNKMWSQATNTILGNISCELRGCTAKEEWSNCGVGCPEPGIDFTATHDHLLANWFATHTEPF